MLLVDHHTITQDYTVPMQALDVQLSRIIQQPQYSLAEPLEKKVLALSFFIHFFVSPLPSPL